MGFPLKTLYFPFLNPACVAGVRSLRLECTTFIVRRPKVGQILVKTHAVNTLECSGNYIV